jgi:hypothetical protein
MKRRTQNRKKKNNRRTRKQRGGMRYNVPNGSLVQSRLERGDDYQPFVLWEKKDAEKELD